MIQENEVGIPMQIFKIENKDQIDLKIVDRTFSRLEVQAANSKLAFAQVYGVTNFTLISDTKILAIHVHIDEEDNHCSIKNRIEGIQKFAKQLTKTSKEEKSEKSLSPKV